jgi:hypothetical protein
MLPKICMHFPVCRLFKHRQQWVLPKIFPLNSVCLILQHILCSENRSPCHFILVIKTVGL